MSELLLLTNAAEPPPEILPALGLLLHSVRTGPADMIALDDAAGIDAILVDARRDLIQARQLCQLLARAASEAPVLAIVTEGGLAAVTADWGTDDVVLHTAGPAEVEARLRLAIGRQATVAAPAAPDEIRSGDLSIDEATYTARLRSRVLDLTFKEFELLKFLAQHPGRVFTRAHLLQEVWGYDYFGGTRTVDVHVRRLRAKLGAEHEALIGTVRNVGYRFVPLKASDDARRGPAREAAAADGRDGAADGRDGAADGRDGAADGRDGAADDGEGPDGDAGPAASHATAAGATTNRGTAGRATAAGGTTATSAHQATRRMNAARAER
jgi:DNA-binding response OmpR family regulator